MKNTAGLSAMEKPAGGLAAFEHLEALLQTAQEKAFPHCEIEKIPIKTSWQNGQGIFSSSLPFLCSKKVGIPPFMVSERLRSCLPKQDRLFALSEKADGYLNFIPSSAWYDDCFLAMSQKASFSSWSATEEDFGFFAGSSPAAAQVQKAFVRLCSVLRNCLAERISFDPFGGPAPLFRQSEELALLFALFRLNIASTRGILPILLETAGAFHHFYDTCRIWSPEASYTCARARLCLICGAEMERSMKALGILFLNHIPAKSK